MPKSENQKLKLLYVVVSDQFLGWIMSLGDGAVIEGPTEVVDRMKQMISGLERIYSLPDSSKTDN